MIDYMSRRDRLQISYESTSWFHDLVTKLYHDGNRARMMNNPKAFHRIYKQYRIAAGRVMAEAKRYDRISKGGDPQP